MQQLLAEGCPPLGEIKCDGPLIAPFTTLNQIVGNKSIDQPDRSRMGQAKDAPQLVVGRAEPVSDDDQRSGGFTGVVEDVSRRFLNAVSDGKPDNSEQIGSAIRHSPLISAARTYFNLTIRALRT